MGVPVKTFTNNQPPALEANDLNALIKEINNGITTSGQAIDTGNLTQLAQALTSYVANATFVTEQIESTPNNYVVSNGTYQNLTALKDGMALRFSVTTPNTGSVTINAFNLGAKPLLNDVGNALVPDDLEAGLVYNILYRTASDSWFIQKSNKENADASIDNKVADRISLSPNGGVTFSGANISIPNAMTIHMPNGKNNDGTLLNTPYTLTSSLGYTLSGTENGEYYLTVSETNIVNMFRADTVFVQTTQPNVNGIWRNPNTNIWYSVQSGVATEITIGILAKITCVSGAITDIENFATLSLATQFDLSRIINIMYSLTAFSSGTNYIKIPLLDGRKLIVQWGGGNIGNATNLTFPIAFSTTPYVSCGGGDLSSGAWTMNVNVNSTGVTLANRGTTNYVTCPVFYIAIGY